MNILLITQARISSTRLNSKVLLSLGSATVLDLHLKRLKKNNTINHFSVAIADEQGADTLVQISERNGFKPFKGSVSDVLDRFYRTALMFRPDVIIRVTSDCPLIDPLYIDDLIRKFKLANVDYASNCFKASLPDGMSAEIFTFSALEKAWHEAKLLSEREHVTPYIWKNSNLNNAQLFKALNVEYEPDLSGLRMTLDYPQDYEIIKHLVDACGEDASLAQYVAELQSYPDLILKSNMIKRNEGYLRSLKNDKVKI